LSSLRHQSIVKLLEFSPVFWVLKLNEVVCFFLSIHHLAVGPLIKQANSLGMTMVQLLIDK
jgi:hypothetical protein